MSSLITFFLRSYLWLVVTYVIIDHIVSTFIVFSAKGYEEEVPILKIRLEKLQL